MREIKSDRITIRADRDTSTIIRSSYELERQKRILEGHKALSLNDYLIGLIETAIEMSENGQAIR